MTTMWLDIAMFTLPSSFSEQLFQTTHFQTACITASHPLNVLLFFFGQRMINQTKTEDGLVNSMLFI